jgi:general secretion pathway protein C
MSTAVRAPLPLHLAALATLACAGLLVASTINTVLAAHLLPPALQRTTPATARAPAAEPATPLSVERLARIAGLTLPDASGTLSVAAGDGPLPTARGLRLLGTLVSARPEASLASLYVEDARRTLTVGAGSALEGAEVLSIERERVLLWTGTRVEQLGLGSTTGAPPPAASASPRLGAGIREVAPLTYVLPREELQRALAAPEELMTQARLVPSFRGNHGTLKLFSIRPDSLFARLGLRNGDTPLRLNGLRLNGVDSALEAYARLRDAPHFELEVERDGQPVRLTYTVRE